jgi:outer membrane protein assembly factor BamB
VYLASGNNTTGTLTANANATGELAWGAPTVNGDGTISDDLYCMSSNQGIQAFVVTVPEPGAFSLMALGLGGLVFRRKLRK